MKVTGREAVNHESDWQGGRQNQTESDRQKGRPGREAVNCKSEDTGREAVNPKVAGREAVETKLAEEPRSRGVIIEWLDAQ